MKFEYTPEPKREPVAYIDVDGDLVIKSSIEKAILLRTNNKVEHGWGWNPESAEKKFYRGDRVTITL